MSSSPISGPALRFGHRLRMRLGGKYDLLASLLGLSTRTLTRIESWSGPTSAALLLLSEAPVSVVPGLVKMLLGGSGTEARKALSDIEREIGTMAPTESFGAALDHSIDWVYWATKERADDVATRRLACNEGIICRPILENAKGEVHGYLFAIRPGDRVLLAHDRKPLVWLKVLEAGPPPRLGSEANEMLDRAGRVNLLQLLPPVFRFVPVRGTLGTILTSGERPYRLFDNQPADATKSGWFSALAVKEVQEKVGDLDVREAGYRSRMTRYEG